MVAATLGKTWDLQCQNGAMTHVSKKTKSRTPRALFLWPVKSMLWISNLNNKYDNPKSFILFSA